MLGYLTEEEKKESRSLWEEAFPEDSRSFVDYYYEEKTRDNRILAIRQGQRVEAMVQMNPYLVQAGSRRWRVDYLVGVATRKEKRHQGYMRRLLLAMMGDMRREGMPFCFLMPASEAIYRPFGFTWIFDQPSWRLKEGSGAVRISFFANGRLTKDSSGSLRLSQLADWMNQWLASRYQVYAIRDEGYLRRLLAELASEGGTADLLMRDGRLAGIIAEWGPGKRQQRLLYGEDGLVEKAGEPKPAIMARILSPERFVRAIRLKPEWGTEEAELCLDLEDPLIPENNGSWLWHLNRESSWLERAGGESRAQLRLTVAELTGWLFGYEVPEAARPFEKLAEPLDGVFLDEVV